MSDADLIRRLRAELDEANETIRQLRATSGGTEIPDWLPHLTGTERKLLALFADGKLYSRDNLMDHLYRMRTEAPEPKIIDVFVVRLRRKLSAVGIEFETLWGQGWRLTPESVELLRPSHEGARAA